MRLCPSPIRCSVASFAAAYPDVTLDITLDDAVTEIVAGGYDAAIRIGEVIERDMVAVRLGPDMRQVAAAAPSYVERNPTGSIYRANWSSTAASAGAGRGAAEPIIGNSGKRAPGSRSRSTVR